MTGSDTVELWQPPCAVRVTFSDEDTAYDSLFFKDGLDTGDKYPVFLDGNHPLTTIENLDKREGDTLLIIKDSYANSLAPLLISHYKRIILVDLRYYRQGVSELVSNNGIRDVLVVYSAENIVADSNIMWLR